ncbi:MAG: helix-turn-helix domain-containing protein, partial [Chloroflexi bacterium]|nr:helix-turn-helix domain-containing protein [Chloroflexota bacterium]
MDNRLRPARLAAGLSQERLARATGISRQAYASIEAGRSVPSTEVALRV